MPRLVAVITATLLAGSALAQDRIEGPFYKFSTAIPGASLNPERSGEDLTLEYFATPDGTISGVELFSGNVGSGPADAGSLMAGCRPMCVPDPSSPTGLRCIGCWGPNSIFVSIDAVPSDGGLDFRVGVQEAFGETPVIKQIEGFRATEGSDLQPLVAPE
ncbi:hypothetical protein [Citreimonas sp.]|uniref:hypothetical protein n=1 Tax=Citreimonas sp. TaxID=3036715 RepID=UPI004057F22F